MIEVSLAGQTTLYCIKFFCQYKIWRNALKNKFFKGMPVVFRLLEMQAFSMV